MFFLTCTIISISCVDLADYGVSRAKDWVSVDCGTTSNIPVQNETKKEKREYGLDWTKHTVT